MYYGNFKIMMLGMSVSTVCYVALHMTCNGIIIITEQES